MAAMPLTAWVVDDDDSVRWVMERALSQDGITVRCFERAEPMLEALETSHPDVLVTDVRMPGIDGLEVVHRLDARGIHLPVIVITAHSDLDSAVAAYQAGAFEYLPKPFDIDEAVALVRRAAHSRAPVNAEQDAPKAMSAMVGKAPAMQDVFRLIGRLSKSSMTVLITGESGTGKELVARALHENSPRARAPFVALNTTAIAADLLESELFGHEKGSFTGADQRRIGRFEQAHSGTLFLDEIGDMSPDLQTRLLRVLAEGEFYRVGGQTPIKVDTRIVAATNQDLKKAVAERRFREDLYHRLNVISVVTPPLRNRREDIPALLNHYLAKSALELGVDQKALTPEALKVLQSFSWPGNVRQLVNACRKLVVLAPGREIRADDISDELGGGSVQARGQSDWVQALQRWAQSSIETADGQTLLAQAGPEFERVLITTALTHARGRRQEAAKLLGWGRNTLTRKIKELGLED
jgi:two-component system, NtrC family, nitrogen regulation response regulator GlnG